MKKIFLSTLLLFAVLMSGCLGEEPADTTGDKKTATVETATPTDDGNQTNDKRDSESSDKRDSESSDKRDSESSDKRDSESSDKRDSESSDKRDSQSSDKRDSESSDSQSDSEDKPTGVSQPGPDAQKTPEGDKEPTPQSSPPAEKDKKDPSFLNFANDPMMIGVIAALAVLTLALIWLIYDRRKMKATIDDMNKPSPNVNTPPQVSTQPTVSNPPPSPPPASNNSEQNTIIFTGTPTARPKPAEKLTVKVGNLQNIGSRKEQQDNFCISDIGDKTATREKGLMAVVADGMGGLEGGATISRLVTETFLNSYKSQAKFDPPTFLYQTAERAEFEVDSYMKRTGVNGGSTVVAVVVKDSMMDYISVGDSHIYLLRGTDLTLINREHSFGALLMEKAARGEVDPNEPYVNPKRNALTAYIGIGNFNTVDRNTQPILLKAGDKILLCSDGVYNALGDDALIDALKGDPINAAKRLEQTILDQAIPSQDNFTAIILECVKA